MEAMNDKIKRATESYEGLKKDLALVKAGKPTRDGKSKSVDMCEKILKMCCVVQPGNGCVCRRCL
jgi:hypothetical protein